MINQSKDSPLEMAEQNKYEDTTLTDKLDYVHQSERGEEGFMVQSQAFANEGYIPVRFCKEGVEGGENISLPVYWNNIPKDTRSLFLVLYDPHPVAEDFIHWAVTGIPPTVTEFAEGASGKDMPEGVQELVNGYGERGYGGPQPPSGTGPHPYTFVVYALNSERIDISTQPSWDEINQKLQPVIIAAAKIPGYYGR